MDAMEIKKGEIGKMNKEFQFLVYNLEEENVNINVKVRNETIWLTQKAMGELFDVKVPAISKHLNNIYEDGELERNSTISKMEIVQKEGNRNVAREVEFYNLDAIISVGYRVNSKKATNFRIWATKVLKEYMIKGFAMDDARLKQGKNLFGNDYFKELLERVRDIRSSEKVFYRQVLDLFATSVDYDSKSSEAKKFFATVQNKMHYAIHHNTASEFVYNRVDANKEFMGLTTFKGELPSLSEAKVAKNYLDEKELRGLNQLVSGYLDFAERQAEREITMKMSDWVKHVDNILTATGEDLLEGNGNVSRIQMEQKVEDEYKKYSANTLTQVEKDYLSTIRNIEKIIKKNKK